jgi:dTDP-4-amino-4,6-dideoxygalactose transaminase
MIATASAIKFTGANPVPIEAGPDLMIDTSKIEEAITSKTKAIMPTQLNGRLANMSKIQDISTRYGLDIFEDSAQALGATYKGKHIGSFGKGGCISFYPAKILGCLGDGGAVVCNDPELYEKMKLMRDHGRSDDGSIKMWGFNTRLDNIQAAILNYFFDFYEQTIERRREIAKIYHENLKDISDIVLPPSPFESGHNFDVFQNYEIQANKRDDLKIYLKENGIGTLVQWGGIALHHCEELGMKANLPFTDLLFEKLLMIPLNMTLTNDQVEYICKKIKHFYN